MHLLKQNTAASVIVGPVLDSTGASYTGMAIGDFNITKNGVSAAMAAAASATHDHNGHYVIALTTGNTDTLGRMVITCNKATYAMSATVFQVLTAATFDAIVTNAAGAANGMFIAGNNAATTVNITGTISTVTTLTNLPAITTDWLTGTGVAASAVTKIQTGLATPTNITAGTLTTVGTATSVGAISPGGIVASSFGSGAITASAFATDSVNANALAADAVAEIWAKAMVELAAVPAVTGTVLQALTWCFEASRNKITQTSSTQTVLKDDSTTTLATSTVSDDGTTFTRSKYS